MDVLWLLRRVVESFHAGTPGVGLPLGNLTSQLLVNVYMNEFDQFAKHRLKAKHYIRYADDFIVLHQDQGVLLEMCAKMGDFLQEELCLDLHPRKVSVTTLARGVDFLGWVHWIDHRVLRSATRHRMMRRLSEATSNATKASYQGMLSHGNARKLSRRVFM